MSAGFGPANMLAILLDLGKHIAMQRSGLDMLEAALARIPLSCEGMTVSEFDGFVAGLIVCPEMIPPSEWWPVVMDDGGPGFEDLEDFESIIGTLMEHYNQVAGVLARLPDQYAPVYELDPVTNETLWEPWASGFERAMRLRMDSWESIVESEDEEAASSVNMMLALAAIDDGTSDLPEATIDQLTEMAPDLIPRLVRNLNAWDQGAFRADTNQCLRAISARGRGRGSHTWSQGR